eukprot:366097-Chlamydomonas_euryale.AAC.6
MVWVWAAGRCGGVSTEQRVVYLGRLGGGPPCNGNSSSLSRPAHRPAALHSSLTIRFRAFTAFRSCRPQAAAMGKLGGGGASARRTPENGGGARSGLSLERFAGAKTSTYDRKAVLQAQREEKIRRHAKYKKLKARLVEQGVLGAEKQPDFQDNGAGQNI